MADEKPTVVIFRVFKPRQGIPGGDIIALFPEITGRNGLCSSYMHVGQHGDADYAGIIADSRPATPEEYASLKRELEGQPYGYVLDVRKRLPHRK